MSQVSYFMITASVPFSPDVEKAIWNTNAFFAYIIAVKLFGLKWEPRRLLAVSLATLGVLAVVYGGSTADSGKPSLREVKLKATTAYIRPTAPLVGDLLTLIASFGYGLYQVLYKKYAALPSDPEILAERHYEQIPGDNSATRPYDETSTTTNLDDVVNPPPFGFHANLLTSIIGLLTFAILWIPIPILHYLDIEPFLLPPNAKTAFAIAGIALTGVIFNAGFMVGI
jgi:drug/metabolite transporter (DMT)-like permease